VILITELSTTFVSDYKNETSSNLSKVTLLFGLCLIVHFTRFMLNK